MRPTIVKTRLALCELLVSAILPTTDGAAQAIRSGPPNCKAVAASAQGRGHGGALLAYLEVVVFRRSKNHFVCVSDFNHQGRRFYERHGYKEIGPILHLLVPGSAEILMRKTSGPAKANK